jgi:hypothetical protein
MARDASLTDRLAARLERGELERVSVPGGGVAYRGETATRALDALGARAMTLDRSIIVRDDFDPSAAEDQALFAHEQYHADHGDGGGGGGGDNYRDAEEVAARAVERMVLNRATAGGFEGGNAPGVGGGATPEGKADGAAVGASAQSPTNRPDDAKRDPEPAAGYAAMRKQGMSHMDIVEELARRVVDATDSAHEHRMSRSADAKSTV